MRVPFAFRSRCSWHESVIGEPHRGGRRSRSGAGFPNFPEKDDIAFFHEMVKGGALRDAGKPYPVLHLAKGREEKPNG
jgi:hypothetical protein